ncbi:MAG: SAM-dependent methyltransferase, partial [Burkholderiales bacterium PBB5]
MQLSPQSFAAVTDFFHQSSGIRLSADKLALVQGRLQRLAAERGDRDLDSYVRQVLSGSDPAEQVRLVDRLTTNETYFFREPQHFAFLAGLLAKRSASQPFRVWSAASSSGEEAYSIAMVLHDRLGDAAWEVVGTDLSTAMVDAARQALYPVSRGQNMPEYYRKQYCLKGEGAYEGQMLIHRKLRERVRFETANLLEPLPALGELGYI